MAAPARAGHQLGDPALRVQALHVVVVAVQHQHGVPDEGLPERLDVGRVAVGAGAVAGPVPEGDAARSRAGHAPAQPADLRRAGGVVHLRVEADELPAGERDVVVGGRAPADDAGPVRVVAGGVQGPVVVARRGQGDGAQRPEDRLIVRREVGGGPPLVHVAQVEEARRPGALDEPGDGERPLRVLRPVPHRPHRGGRDRGRSREAPRRGRRRGLGPAPRRRRQHRRHRDDRDEQRHHHPASAPPARASAHRGDDSGSVPRGGRLRSDGARERVQPPDQQVGGDRRDADHHGREGGGGAPGERVGVHPELGGERLGAGGAQEQGGGELGDRGQEDQRGRHGQTGRQQREGHAAQDGPGPRAQGARRVLELRGELRHGRLQGHQRQRQEEDGVGHHQQDRALVQAHRVPDREVHEGQAHHEPRQRARQIDRALEDPRDRAPPPDGQEGHRQRQSGGEPGRGQPVEDRARGGADDRRRRERGGAALREPVAERAQRHAEGEDDERRRAPRARPRWRGGRDARATAGAPSRRPPCGAPGRAGSSRPRGPGRTAPPGPARGATRWPRRSRAGTRCRSRW